MERMGFMQAERTLGRSKAADIRNDLRRIDAAFSDHARAPLAAAALHLAAGIVEQGVIPPLRSGPITDAEREAFAAFGIDTSENVASSNPLDHPSVVRGLQSEARMIAGALPLADAARKIGVDASRLRQRIAEGTLLAIRRPKGRAWLVPAFQMTENGELPHLARVLSHAQRHLSAWSVEGAFETPDEETGNLGARDWLMAGGDPAPVERLVAGL